ncbi:ABC transporter ATP-binding protein [Cellulomonas telluris]|uniref:ABC transporter ATP-binding protein n=1 Tax=Cellulomonas telluris TaxID=2306636 RepID=UPI0010A91F7E|nr:ABC transporter ATP-binding protein [Cellulomonas telluris]
MAPSSPAEAVRAVTGYAAVTSVQVAVDDVHVRYRTPSTDAAANAEVPRPVRVLNRVIGRQPTVLNRALAGISLVARSGEAVGVVGLNGSGKSTLLRIIAGLERPARGTVLARTTPVLLGVNAAMLPELTGQQNVRLGCLAMGMTPEQVSASYKEIVELSGLGPAIHQPMKTYSSGMGARLKFAIAAAANPQILLIDEALATGDAAFRERSEERMSQLRENAGCTFLVSHAAKTIEETCTRAIWLHKGRLVMDGGAYDVAQKYRWWAWNVAKGETEKAAGLLEDAFGEGHDTAVRVTDLYDPSAPPRHARRD